MKTNFRLILTTAAASTALAIFSPALLAADALASAPSTGVDNPQPSSGTSSGSTTPTTNTNTNTAQDGQGKHGRKLEKLAQALGLTDQQKSAIKPILQQRRSQVLAIRNNSLIPADQKKEQIKQIRKSTREQIKAILTPEQQQKLMAMRKLHHDQHAQQQQ